MQGLKKIFSFYIYSNIHVAIAVFCLTKLTLIENGNQDNISPSFVFLSTIISYNFIRFYNIDKIKIEASNWLKSYQKSLIVLNLICVLILLVLVFKLQLKAIVLLIPFALATLFYSVPFAVNKMNLRSVAFLKLFLIAISWAGITVLFPLINSNLKVNISNWILFFQRFLFIIAITIPFDIRDLEFDTSNIKTLPNTVGVKNSKFIGLVSLLIFIILELFLYVPAGNDLIITLLIVFLSALFLVGSSKKQNKYYSSFWVEAIPILWFFLVYFSKGINF